MDKVVQIIRRKPFLFVLLPLAYIIVVGFLKWRFQPPLMESALFVAGGLLGIYFLEIAELFFNITPSPFRSILFMGLFVAVSFFIVTSATTLLASGLVLSLYCTLLLRQEGEWASSGNLNSWYSIVAGSVPTSVQRWIFFGCIGLFLLETFFFIR